MTGSDTTELTPHGSRSVILTVAEVIDETHDARSIVFELPDTAKEAFTQYKSGQFLTLRIPSDQTGRWPAVTRWPPPPPATNCPR